MRLVDKLNKRPTKHSTKCPVNQDEYCHMKMCAWYDQQQGVCSILLIARSLDDLSHEGIWNQSKSIEEKVCQKSDKAPIDTKKEVASAIGISHDTLAKLKEIEEQETAELQAFVEERG